MGLDKSKCTPKKLKSCFKTFLVHLFSHVGLCLLIVSYAVGGGFIFQHLEFERDNLTIVKFEERKNAFPGKLDETRKHYVAKLWEITDRYNVLWKENWTKEVAIELNSFGDKVIEEYAAIGRDTRICNHTFGWRNIELSHQWNFTQALLYSVSIITTIGYGNTSPETPGGRIFTMFYAVLGVPLMLLWVSNIGNLMAKTFKFGYFHAPYCGLRKKRNSIKKPVQTSPSTKRRKSSTKSKRKSHKSPTPTEIVSTQIEYSFGDEKIETKIVEQINSSTSSSPKILKRSLSDRSSTKSLRDLEPGAKQVLLECAEYNMSISQGQDERSRRIIQQLHPSFTNKAIVEGNEDGDEEDSEDRSDVQSVIEVTSTIPQINSTYGPIPPPLNFDEVDQVHEINAEPMYPSSTNFYGNGNGKLGSRKVSIIETLQIPYGTPSKVPLLMDSTGIENNIIDIENIEPDISTKEISSSKNIEADRVPVSLVLFVVVLYLCFGALAFSKLEGWDFLQSVYFCFITLSTIGLGDLVPGKSLEVSDGTRAATYQLLFCCFYLVIGLAIIAMSFNLVQEQVTIKVRDFARRIGIIEEKYI